MGRHSQTTHLQAEGTRCGRDRDVAGFIGLELYEGVDADGMAHALESLDRLALEVEAVDDRDPVTRRAPSEGVTFGAKLAV